MDEALALCRQALAADPGDAQAMLLASEAAFILGHVTDAQGYLEDLVKARPDDAQAHYNQGFVLQQMGRFEDAIAAYQEAIKIDSKYFDAHNNSGICFFNLGRRDDDRNRLELAAAAYRFTLGIRPDSPNVLSNFGLVLQDLGHVEDAITAHRRAVELDPKSQAYTTSLATAILAAGRPESALEVADAYLEGHPFSPSMLALRAAALTDLGRGDEAGALVDHGRLIRSVRPAAPQGFADLDAFNVALADHILGHPTLRDAALGQTVSHGRQTADLLIAPEGPFVDFGSVVRTAMDEYWRELGGDAGHPFLGRQPSDVRIEARATVLAPGEHEPAHIHPLAWLAGLYVVRLPGASTAGRVEFSQRLVEPADGSEPARMPIEAVEGSLVLFPAYLAHATLAGDGDEPYIAIALEAIPEA